MSNGTSEEGNGTSKKGNGNLRTIVVSVIGTLLSTFLVAELGRLNKVSIYKLLGGHVEWSADVSATAIAGNVEVTKPLGSYDICMLKEVTIQVDPLYADVKRRYRMGSCTLTWDKEKNLWAVNARYDQPDSATGGTTCVASCVEIR